MVRRSQVSVADIADLATLSLAFWRAARCKRQRTGVRHFAANLDSSLGALSADLRKGSLDLGEFERFVIHDPKRRTIHAPVFRERVLHHAIMHVCGPVLDRSLVDDTFACRPGLGPHAAALRAQRHLRRFPWYFKADIRAFFDSVDHEVLLELLRRRFKDPSLLQLFDQVVRCYETRPGHGLPIGALTSQHFANFVLSPLDRELLERIRVGGYVRYMDDVLGFTATKAQARAAARRVSRFVEERLGLQLRERPIIQPSRQGVVFCGYRVLPGTLLLSRRRKNRYAAARRRWETAWRQGWIDADGLRQGYASALAITNPADSVGFRREQLRRVPAPDA
jgi:hypothetical protein